MRLAREKNIVYRIISVCLVFTLVFSSFAPTAALAARSRAGGGKISKPDWGNVAQNVGITVGTVVISSGLSSAWNTAAPVNQSAGFLGMGKLGTDIANIPTTIGNLLTNTPGNPALIVKDITPWGQAFSSLNSLSKVAPIIVKGYATYTAGTQVSRMIGMMGQYYKWSPKTTFAISSLGVGATAGFLNPSAALGETFSPALSTGSAMLKGAFVGGLSGWASAATIGAIDGDKINAGENPGITAQLLGTASGLFATEFGKTLLDPRTYSTVWEKGTFKPQEKQDWMRGSDGEWHQLQSGDFEQQREFSRREEMQQRYERDILSGYGTYKPAETQVWTRGPDGEWQQVMSAGAGTKFEIRRPDGEWQQVDADTFARRNFTATGEFRPQLLPVEQVSPIEKFLPQVADIQTVSLPARYERGDGSYITAEAAKEINSQINKFLPPVSDTQTVTMSPRYVTPSGYSIAVDELKDATGVKQLDANLQARNLRSKTTDLSVSDGVEFMQMRESQDYLGGISSAQLEHAYNIRPLTGNTLYLPVSSHLPTSAQILSRILVNPLVTTINHWPILVTRWLDLEYERKNDNKWTPVAQEAIYAMGVPLLDSAATIWNLKMDIGEKLGYPSEVMYQREQFYRRAVVERIFTEISHNKDNIDALVKDLHLNSDDRAKLDEIMKKDIDDKERMKQLSIAIQNMVGKYGDSPLKVYKRIGGSKGEIFSRTLSNVLFSELPIALISGSIEVGMNDSLSGKSSTKAMSAALRNITISGAVRGLIWHDYGKDLFWKQIGAIAEGDRTPLEGSSSYIPVSEAETIAARINGWLPLVDDRRFNGEKEYWRGNNNEWQRVERTELQTQVNKIADFFGIERDKVDLSQAELADVVQAINRVNPGDIKLEFTEGGGRLRITPADQEGVSEWVPDYEFGEGAWRRVDNGSEELNVISNNKLQQLQARVAAQESLASLSSIQERIARVKPDSKGSYQLNTGVDISPVADAQGFHKLVLKPYQKSALETNTVAVFGAKREDVKDGYIMRTPGEAHNYLQAIFTVHNGEIGPTGKYEVEHNGKRITAWGPYEITKPAELMPTIVGSLSQSLFEFGWQSLAMGLPYTYQGKMGSYGWLNYLDTLKYLASSAAQAGLFNVMGQYATSTGAAQNFGVAKSLVGRNTLTAIADTPVGEWLGMARFIPVTGFTGMPFSVAANIQTGLKTIDTRYYPYWPYQRVNVVPNDPFWRGIKVGMVYKYGQVNLPTVNLQTDINAVKVDNREE